MTKNTSLQFSSARFNTRKKFGCTECGLPLWGSVIWGDGCAGCGDLTSGQLGLGSGGWSSPRLSGSTWNSLEVIYSKHLAPLASTFRSNNIKWLLAEMLCISATN